MPVSVAVEFCNEPVIGASLRVEFIGELVWQAGFDVPAHAIRQQYGMRLRREHHAVAFGVMHNGCIFTFGPRDALPARHIAELVDQALGGGMQHYGALSFEEADISTMSG